MALLTLESDKAVIDFVRQALRERLETVRAGGMTLTDISRRHQQLSQAQVSNYLRKGEGSLQVLARMEKVGEDLGVWPPPKRAIPAAVRHALGMEE